MPAFDWSPIIASAVAGLFTLLGIVIVQLFKLRRENTAQHDQNRAVTEDVRERLLDIHTNVDHVGRKVDQVAEKIDRHEQDYHGLPTEPAELRPWR